MTCSICRESYHDARCCNHPRINETYQAIVRMLCCERNHPTSVQLVRDVHMGREKMPFWNNIWIRLQRMVWHYQHPYHPRRVVMQFLAPKPQTITELKQRFRSWINNDVVVNAYEAALLREPHPPRPLVPKMPKMITMTMDDMETEYYGDVDCAICMEALDKKKTVAYSCKHTFCASCVQQHVVKHTHQVCPKCREPIEHIRFKSDLNSKHFNKLVDHLMNIVVYR